MKVTIHPSQLKGEILAPASKSSMQRACAAALLSKGRTVLKNPGHSNDDKAAIGIIKALGASVVINNEQLIINNSNFPESSQVPPLGGDLEGAAIDCGESGLSIRMFTPIAALSEKEITINGSGSLATRPMNFFDEIFPQLGVKIKSNNGKLPLVIQGPLQPKNMEVDGSLSSQFLTGLLMAYAASPNPSEGGASEDSGFSKTVSIKVHNLKSKPYIDLTLDVMKKFGMRVPENKNYEEFIYHNDFSKIPPSVRRTPDSFGGGGGAYTVEGDWSSASFLLVAGAIAGPVTVKGLDMNSTQADKAIMEALISARAVISTEADWIKIQPGDLKGFQFDATDCPDLFPPLVALAVYCNGQSIIRGVHRLAHKESNRAFSLQQEFGKMGVRFECKDDSMIIFGNTRPKTAKVHSHHDHRIAMACAVAALKADGGIEIEDAEAVNKSYPGFYNDFKSLGADISTDSYFVNLKKQ